MLTNDHIDQLLELLEHPAFSVRDGLITGANTAARERLIPLGEEISPLILEGTGEFESLSGGSMVLTLSHLGLTLRANVTCVGETRIFRLEPDPASDSLRALALAAQELRTPLHDAMALTRAMQEEEPAMPPEELAARLSRELHRILRIVGNMSFHSAPRLEMRDVCAVLAELFESAAVCCEAAGVKLSYTALPTVVYSLADSDLLGRAVHNLLTNAIRGAGSGGTIAAKLTRRGNTLYLTVSDSGGGKSPAGGRVFDAWRREPGLGTQGLGLGMTIVEAAAKAHGGVVMVESTDDGTRVTMSLPIRQSGSGLRSPTVRVDYAGEHSRELIEFSEVLPPEFYK